MASITKAVGKIPSRQNIDEPDGVPLPSLELSWYKKEGFKDAK